MAECEGLLISYWTLTVASSKEKKMQMAVLLGCSLNRQTAAGTTSRWSSTVSMSTARPDPCQLAPPCESLQQFVLSLQESYFTWIVTSHCLCKIFLSRGYMGYSISASRDAVILLFSSERKVSSFTHLIVRFTAKSMVWCCCRQRICFLTFHNICPQHLWLWPPHSVLLCLHSCPSDRPFSSK